MEITESVFEQESDELYRQLVEIHDLCVKLSLDDFGTGYSSLLYLERYPFDEIKIDQAFMRNMIDDAYNQRVVDTVLTFAATLDAEAVAEGVENVTLRDALLERGCQLGHGFYYSRPLESNDLASLLKRGLQLPAA